MHTPDRGQRELLSAYREGERMPAVARAAAWSRLQAAIHADALHEELAAGERRTSGRRLHWGVVLFAAAALVVLLAGLRDHAGWADRAGSARDSQAAHDAVDARPDTPRLRSADAPTSLPPPAPPPVLPARSSPAAAPKLAPRTAGLDAELALLRSARTALAAGAGGEALTLLSEHARRFPAGHLGEERRVLRVQALCAVGRRDDAREAAAELATLHPASPHLPMLATLCQGP